MSDNPNAFPACNEANVNGTMGMTLRDWFAGQALGAAWQGFDKGYYEGDTSSIAACAYQIADAMLAERSKS